MPLLEVMMVLHKKPILSHVLWQSISPGSDNTYPDNKEGVFILNQTKLMDYRKYKDSAMRTLKLVKEILKKIRQNILIFS